MSEPEVWVDWHEQKVRFKIGVQTFTLEVLPVGPRIVGVEETFGERPRGKVFTQDEVELFDALEWYSAQLRHAFDGLQKRLAATEDITQEMVDKVRWCATLASPDGVTPASAETFRAADILQALLDAGGDDE